MGWASRYIEKLQSGQEVSFRPRGNSMVPRIKSGKLVKLKPYKMPEELNIGDVVLARVQGRQYLHLISAKKPLKVQISNAHGHINGWAPLGSIYGVLIKISD